MDGKAKVHDDNKLVASIDLTSSKTAHGRIVLVRSWATSGTHVIRIFASPPRVVRRSISMPSSS